MPNRDRTGPMGNGPRTGRGMGLCNGKNPSESILFGNGAGRGRFNCFGFSGRLSRRNGTPGNRFRFFQNRTTPLNQPVAEGTLDLNQKMESLELQLKQIQDQLSQLTKK